jgi:hypothetical protein
MGAAFTDNFRNKFSHCVASVDYSVGTKMLVPIGVGGNLDSLIPAGLRFGNTGNQTTPQDVGRR